MSDNKSNIKIIIIVCLGVLLPVGRLLKSCGKAAKGGVKAIDNVENLSHIKVPKGVTELKSSHLAEIISHLNDVNSVVDKFMLPHSNPTKREINALLGSSGLAAFLLDDISDSLQIDSIHQFIDLKIYVPNVYTVPKYFNTNNSTEFVNGLERIRIFKSFSIPPNRKLGEWQENNKGIRYRMEEATYDNEILEYSYHLRTERSLYQIHYSRVVNAKEDIPKYLFRLEAFIQLIEEDYF